jgi:hypothetical protein
MKTTIEKLTDKVIAQLGDTSYLQDVANHGAGAGFPGFTYYSDTHKFAMANRKLIVELLEETASDMGEDVVKMVSSFGVFRNTGFDNDDRKELYKYLGDGRCKQSTVTNVMAWFALEEVARYVVDNKPELLQSK